MINREAAVIPNIYRDARILHAAYRPTFVKSMVMVPIRKLDPIGAIGNYWAHERQPSEQEVSLLQALADATSIAMEHIQIYAELEQRVRDRTAELETANEEIRQPQLSARLHRRRRTQAGQRRERPRRRRCAARRYRPGAARQAAPVRHPCPRGRG
jgi:GAF domain-containing protein